MAADDTPIAPAEHDATVTVTFNGQDKNFAFHPHELVSALLERAKKEFNVEGQHLLSLFSENGVELPDGETLHQAGVRPGALLVLRQSTVKGGGV
jgi:hypothetical protein